MIRHLSSLRLRERPIDLDSFIDPVRLAEAAGASPAELAIADIAATVGLKKIQVVSWRDLDDPEAGGSEIHAAMVAKIWSESGISVSMRTSRAPGNPAYSIRDGYSVERKSGRYASFPRTAASGISGHLGDFDGLVEIWNGMPFFSPIWCDKPKIVFLHHVHAEMWGMVLPPNKARLGWLIESKLAPPLYRKTKIVTLSESSRSEIIDILRLPPENVSVVPPGIDPVFAPGEGRSPTPLIVAVGRLVPVKRFHLLIDGVARLKALHPKLRLVIVGEGYERAALESKVAALAAKDWISLPGRLPLPDLVNLYRSAWVVASASAREGWGMTLTEAAACGTPVVATDIAGHQDAVDHGKSGFLSNGMPELTGHLEAVLGDFKLRQRLTSGAVEHASRFSWETTARATLEMLAIEKSRSTLG